MVGSGPAILLLEKNIYALKASEVAKAINARNRYEINYRSN